MALHLIQKATRLSLVAGVTVLVASCASPRAPVVSEGPSAMVMDEADTSDVSARPDSTAAAPVRYIDPAVVNPDAPADYTVVRGDTLWDISGRFLKEPWRWPEIWDTNPQIADPHWIYPGDALALRYVNGQPNLTLTRSDGSVINTSSQNGTGVGGRTRLSPSIRSEPIEDAIPLIKSEDISQFLIHPLVADSSTLENAPYAIADSDGKILSSLGSKIYVRGQVDRNHPGYSIYRKSKPLIDPVNGARLGFEILHVADAKLLNAGDVSTFGLTRNIMETRPGDILLPTTTEIDMPDFTPRLPQLQGEARVASLVGAISQSGRDQIIVLNVGSQSNIEAGDVLAIETRGGKFVDDIGGGGEVVELPDQRTGVVLVFKTFDKVSYALVMESTSPIKINDIVTGI